MQIIHTEVSILPHHSGFGMYQRGELHIGPGTSFAFESDLLNLWAGNGLNFLPLAEALQDADFRAAGVEDVRGLIHNQPAAIFAILEEDPSGPVIRYAGIEQSEVADDFFGQ